MTDRPRGWKKRRSARVVRSITKSPRRSPASLDHVPPFGPRAAGRLEGAVRAVLAGARCEPFVEDLSGGVGQQFADPLPLQRLLGLHLGQGLAARALGGALAQLDQFGAAGFGAHSVEGLVDGAFADGELVDGELGV